MTLKSNINVCIAKKGLSKKEVANRMRVSQTVLSRWINGHSKPSLENAFKLADLLDCKVDDLYERNSC
ncbi:helix-turn-helix transcriptional regulator [Gracilibacillus lacisalsi]|uniref:helix-turn-helix transcriptional regulator n=1 Tax=Gracilibacillus lacisalsi TaxID=393087 RepID=UPI0003781F91|nr:helix-turn-helix transcriptional regulator [Gracilibacillus lacisalsi]